MQTQHIALAWFLILVTIGIIVLLSIVIVVKRRVSRRKSRIDRGKYTPYAYGLSKVWKERIERLLNTTVRIRTEPHVFCAHYSELFDTYQTNKQVTFLFRAKAVDEFLKLKESILSICPFMEAPPIRGIHAFLMTARDDAMNPPPSRDLIEEYCRLYLWARHDLEPFGEAEYRKLCEIQNVLMTHVTRAAALHDSGASTTPSTTCLRKNSVRRSNLRAQPVASKSSDVHSRSSMKSELSHTDRIHSSVKSGSVNISLKRLSYGPRKRHELLVSPTEPSTKAPVTLSTTTVDVNYSKATPRPNVSGASGVTSSSAVVQSRRGSCQSDGSQTALIELEPSILAAKGSTQTVRHPRSNDAFEAVEKKLILDDPNDSQTGAAVKC